MKIVTNKAHPQGKGRAVDKRYRIVGTGSSTRGNGSLPDDTDCVSVSGNASDGEDDSVSSRVFITFGLDDDPGSLDSLIGRLTDLRARMRRDRLK